jgi:hypothetical protein
MTATVRPDRPGGRESTKWKWAPGDRPQYARNRTPNKLRRLPVHPVRHEAWY